MSKFDGLNQACHRRQVFDKFTFLHLIICTKQNKRSYYKCWHFTIQEWSFRNLLDSFLIQIESSKIELIFFFFTGNATTYNYSSITLLNYFSTHYAFLCGAPSLLLPYISFSSAFSIALMLNFSKLLVNQLAHNHGETGVPTAQSFWPSHISIYLW